MLMSTATLGSSATVFREHDAPARADLTMELIETEPQHAQEATHALVGALEPEQDGLLAWPAGHVVQDGEGESAC
jgi:hypothetical protein